MKGLKSGWFHISSLSHNSLSFFLKPLPGTPLASQGGLSPHRSPAGGGWLEVSAAIVL